MIAPTKPTKKRAPLTTGSKVCTKCGEEKPRTEFDPHPSANGDGRHWYCHSCLADAKKASRLKKLDHYRRVNLAAYYRRKEKAAQELAALEGEREQDAS